MRRFAGSAPPPPLPRLERSERNESAAIEVSVYAIYGAFTAGSGMAARPAGARQFCELE